jgi:hypothetical protein
LADEPEGFRGPRVKPTFDDALQVRIVAVWVLSILLAIPFFAVSIPKLAGSESWYLPSAGSGIPNISTG